MSEKMIGERIAYYRKKAGMSQEKVAEYMEVSRQAVTKWEGDIFFSGVFGLLTI